MSKTINEKKIRIYDGVTLDQIDRLLKTGEFGSFNDLINRALRIALPMLTESTIDPKGYRKNLHAEMSDDKTAKRVKDIMLTIDEMYVALNIQKWLMSTLYNIELSKIEGLELSPEIIESGVLANLPAALEKIETEMIIATKKTREKESN